MWEPLVRDTPSYSTAGHRIPGERTKPTPPNDQAHPPGPLQELFVARNQCCGPGQVQRLVSRHLGTNRVHR